MKKLKAIYETKEEVPEGLEEYYSEREGKWMLNPIDGMKSEADVTRLQTSLTKERDEHKKTRDKLKQYEGLGDNPEEVQQRLDRIEELEAAAGGKLDETKINQMVETRLKARLAPVERERDKFKKELDEATGQLTTLNTQITTGKIESSLRRAAEAAKIHSSAIDDVVEIGVRAFEITEEGKVLSKGTSLDPDLWLADMKTKRPHWWPASEGAGANGSGGKGGAGGNNPWSKDHWNITEQGKVIREKGQQAAENLAKAAGSFVGATKPAA